MATKVKVTGNCSIYVLGMEMNCPLCGTLVQSGENHACQKAEPVKPKPRKRLTGKVGR